MATMILKCPTCGGRIVKVKRSLAGKRGGRRYTVPGLEFFECRDCGEKAYDRQAMMRIEEKSSSYAAGKRVREKTA